MREHEIVVGLEPARLVVTAIAAELEARRIAEGVAARPGMAERIAGLMKAKR